MGKGPLLLLSGLSLKAADLSKSQPAYYMTMKAENRAGLRSQAFHLPPILIVPGDIAGSVLDGPGPQDINAQTDLGLVQATFSGFRSPAYGLFSFQVAVGSHPGWDDVQPFSQDGVVNADGNRGCLTLSLRILNVFSF